MFRKATFLIAAWYSLALIVSGCCNCSPNPARKFRWTSMDLRPYRYSIDSASVRIQDTSSDFVSQNAAIEVRMTYELIAANHRSFPGIIGCAYACKCDIEQLFIPERRVTNMKIFTLYDYDTGHPEMSDVTGYFKEPVYIPDTGYVMGQLNPPGTTAEINNASLNYFVFLVTKPIIGNEHQFRIVFSLNDGSELSDTTALLRF